MYSQFTWSKLSVHRNNIQRIYEPLQPYILHELATMLEIKCFIDVGANIGTYSIFMSSVSGIKEIHAFEPAPSSYHELVSNIRLNKCEDLIFPYNIAVSDNCGEVNFGICSGLSGTNSILDTTIHKHNIFSNTVKINTENLDNLIKIDTGIICLKIDVEGHEIEVLNGSKNILNNNKCFIQIENYYPEDNKMFKKLNEYGYEEIFHIGPDYYMSNFKNDFDEGIIVNVFQQAARKLILTNLEVAEQQAQFDEANKNVRPIRRKMAPNFTLEISGQTAKLAHSLKSRLQKFLP